LRESVEGVSPRKGSGSAPVALIEQEKKGAEASVETESLVRVAQERVGLAAERPGAGKERKE
jgi:hypothetical protein